MEWAKKINLFTNTSCGCNDGQCDWDQNTEYENCLADLNE